MKRLLCLLLLAFTLSLIVPGTEAAAFSPAVVKAKAKAHKKKHKKKRHKRHRKHPRKLAFESAPLAGKAA